MVFSLATLSLGCNEQFIKETLDNGPMALKIKYRFASIEEAITIAKQIVILVGMNAKEPISHREIDGRLGRLLDLHKSNAYAALGMLCIAYQNEGQSLAGALTNMTSHPMAFRKRAFVGDKDILHPIVIEYMWKAVGAYSQNHARVAATNGPLLDFIQSNAPEVDGSNREVIFRKLGEELKSGDTDAELNGASILCPVYGQAWRRAITR